MNHVAIPLTLGVVSSVIAPLSICTFGVSSAAGVCLHSASKELPWLALQHAPSVSKS